VAVAQWRPAWGRWDTFLRERVGCLGSCFLKSRRPCRGRIAGNENPQALWVLSHDACVVYGLNFTIAHAGRPTGKIVLESSKGDLAISKGSAMLLLVNQPNLVSQTGTVSN
jgi:hypothetical protein